MKKHNLLYIFITLICSIGILSCSAENTSVASEKTNENSNVEHKANVDSVVKSADKILLDVYKSPTCGCCNKWIEHMEQNGFTTKAHHPENMSLIKEKYKLHNHAQSCHTAVSENGYVFEGHIPAKIVQQFLDNVPDNAVGLASPAMPVGSPGMEVGDKFTPYVVMLVKNDGSMQPFAEVKTQAEQY